MWQAKLLAMHIETSFIYLVICAFEWVENPSLKIDFGCFRQ